MLSNGLRQLDLEVNDDVYWGLTRLGAELKMHPQEYVEHILKAHVEHELAKQASH